MQHKRNLKIWIRSRFLTKYFIIIVEVYAVEWVTIINFFSRYKNYNDMDIMDRHTIYAVHIDIAISVLSVHIPMFFVTLTSCSTTWTLCFYIAPVFVTFLYVVYSTLNAHLTETLWSALMVRNYIFIVYTR